MKCTLTQTVCRFFLPAIFICLVSGQSLAENGERLIVGAIEKFPPQYQLNAEGEPEGFAIDLIEAVAAQSGLSIEYRIFNDWENLQNALISGDVDLIPDLGITAERLNRLSFSVPTSTFTAALFVRDGTRDLNSLQDFKNRHLGTVGCSVEKMIPAEYQAQPIDYADTEDALLGLLSGRIDGVVCPRPVMENLARRARLEHRITIVGTPILEVKRAMAVLKENRKILDRLTPALDDLLQSGGFGTIYTRWHGSQSLFWTTKRLTLLFTGILSLMACSALIWRFWVLRTTNARLQAAVAHQTAELRDSEHRYRTLVNNQNDAVFLHRFSPEGFATFEEVNDVAITRYGYSRDEFLQIGPPAITLPEDVALHGRRQRRNTLLEEGQAIFETTHIRKSGEHFPVEINANIIDLHGSKYILAAVRDISERKQAQAMREELEEQLRQKAKMEAVGLMAGGIAHNFNNNLSIILGNVDLAQLKLAPRSAAYDYLDNAKTAILRTRDLTRHLLAYSRNDSYKKRTMRLAPVVEETVKLLRSTIPTSVDMQLQISAEAAESTIDADATRIQNALLNLCNNAVHAMDEKGALTISLETRLLQAEDIPIQYPSVPGEYVCLQVEDSGCGMTEETLNKIFDPFFTTKTVGEGTGMGLSTVQGMVDQHGGLIKVHSTPGQGSTFRLFFPTVTKAPTEETTSKQGPCQGTENILVVDDEEMLAGVTEGMLTAAGYQATVMTDSRQALELFRQTPSEFDLLITDQTMPELTGKELVAELRRHRPNLPVILCTGYSSKIDAAQAEQLGINAFLMKPLELSVLLETVRNVLDNTISKKNASG